MASPFASQKLLLCLRIRGLGRRLTRLSRHRARLSHIGRWVEVLRLFDEIAGVGVEVLPDVGVGGQIIPELRMALDVSAVIAERGVGRDVATNVLMVVEELREAGHSITVVTVSIG